MLALSPSGLQVHVASPEVTEVFSSTSLTRKTEKEKKTHVRHVCSRLRSTNLLPLPLMGLPVPQKSHQSLARAVGVRRQGPGPAEEQDLARTLSPRLRLLHPLRRHNARPQIPGVLTPAAFPPGSAGAAAAVWDRPQGAGSRVWTGEACFLPPRDVLGAVHPNALPPPCPAGLALPANRLMKRKRKGKTSTKIPKLVEPVPRTRAGRVPTRDRELGRALCHGR